MADEWNFSSSGPDDFRAEIARHRLEIYRLAVRVGLHPSNLSAVLYGHKPMTPDLRQRIHDAIVAERAAVAAGR